LVIFISLILPKILLHIHEWNTWMMVFWILFLCWWPTRCRRSRTRHRAATTSSSRRGCPAAAPRGRGCATPLQVHHPRPAPSLMCLPCPVRQSCPWRRRRSDHRWLRLSRHEGNPFEGELKSHSVVVIAACRSISHRLDASINFGALQDIWVRLLWESW
jgi:hypothetical protein